MLALGAIRIANGLFDKAIVSSFSLVLSMSQIVPVLSRVAACFCFLSKAGFDDGNGLLRGKD